VTENLFRLLDGASAEEQVETLASGESVRIERIVSTGQATPEGEWYNQVEDEWVALLQGEAVLSYGDGRRLHLTAGDHILISAHERHRVESTSSSPPCIWIAVHGGLTET
jgi:cupin 2 domain-containing protein